MTPENLAGGLEIQLSKLRKISTKTLVQNTLDPKKLPNLQSYIGIGDARWKTAERLKKSVEDTKERLDPKKMPNCNLLFTSKYI